MKPVYIFDLDGTLADIEHRVHHIQGEKKDWRAFFSACVDDKPIASTINVMVALMQAGCEVWLWTGRSGEVATSTREWLAKHAHMPHAIRMRAQGDYRADHIIKKEWLDNLHPEDRERVMGVFEDRDAVVQMWRECGLTCYQVAPGNF